MEDPGQATAERLTVFNHHLTWAERYEIGKSLRTQCPHTSHATWNPPATRPNPVDVVLEADKGRMPDLLPLRHGRMARSPFTFYRGSALAMAVDLANTPVSGIRVQACGDAHLSNFGGFATPERRVIFAINDLDETLPAPWEWDVKRLAASFVVASRNNGHSEAAAQNAALTCVATYRKYMVQFSKMKALELWYTVLTSNDLIAGLKDKATREQAIKRVQKESAKSIAEDIFPKLAQSAGTTHFIKDQLPTIFHSPEHTPGEIAEVVQKAFTSYRETLTPSVRTLLDRFEIKDAAIKVVGVGSVGTHCWVLLLMAGPNDPLFLQVKQARPSVLEPFAGKSVFSNHGQRVVNGQRIIQPYSDIFLGWTLSELGTHLYIRQLRDIKISITVEAFKPKLMITYAEWCGRALALAHARSGDAVMISGYMGRSDTFDQAIATFSLAYADQNEKDYTALDHAIRSGKMQAVFEK
jgi:uncharacterized protein (DUF2252 family)